MSIPAVNRAQAQIINSVQSTGINTFKFPNNLNSNRYIKIEVWDTSQNDIFNAGIEASASGVISAVNAAFSTIGGSLSAAISTKNASNKPLPKIDKAVVYLPFPNNLSESLSHTYGEENGWFDTASAVTSSGLSKGAAAGFNTISANVAKATGTQAYQYYENKVQMYQNSEFRTIELSWDLVPNNAQESRNIHEIIKELKKYSSPSLLAGKIILKAPYYFGLTFSSVNNTLDKALQFKEVNITSIQVDYSPGGQGEMFKDELPKHVQLSISFQDREPKTQEDWDKKPENPSSGGTC